MTQRTTKLRMTQKWNIFIEVKNHKALPTNLFETNINAHQIYSQWIISVNNKYQGGKKLNNNNFVIFSLKYSSNESTAFVYFLVNIEKQTRTKFLTHTTLSPEKYTADKSFNNIFEILHGSLQQSNYQYPR